jgi:hypothetical protein
VHKESITILISLLGPAEQSTADWGGSSYRHSLSHNLEAKVRDPRYMGQSHPEAAGLGSQRVSSPHVVASSVCVLTFSSYKDSSRVGLGSLYLNHLWKDPSLSTVEF